MISIEKILSCPLLKNVNVNDNCQIGDYAIGADEQVYLICGIEEDHEGIEPIINYDAYNLRGKYKTKLYDSVMLRLPKELGSFLSKNETLLRIIEDNVYYAYHQELEEIFNGSLNKLLSRKLMRLLTIYYLDLLCNSKYDDDKLELTEKNAIQKICKDLKISKIIKRFKNSNVRHVMTYDGAIWEVKKHRGSKMQNKRLRKKCKAVNDFYHYPKFKNTKYEYVRKLS